MGKKFKFVSIAGMHYLMDGLAFKVGRCAEVLDATLISLDEQTGIPTKSHAGIKRAATLTGL